MAPHDSTEEGRSDQPSTSVDAAALVRRLALDIGLSPQQAEDVCVVTLDSAALETAEAQNGWVSSTQLLRTAVEQCVVARRLAWRRRRAPRIVAEELS